MAQAEVFLVPGEQVRAFQEDGAVMIKGVLNDEWLAELEAGITLDIEQPSDRMMDWLKGDASGKRLCVDTITVGHNPHLHRYMTQSPLGPIAAQMFGEEKAHAFYATVFVRSPGTRSRTPWHQDQTYWCAEGCQALSVWTSIDPVPQGTELQFVKGSHLWEKPLAKPHFEDGNLGGEMDLKEYETIPVPDFSGSDCDEYEFLGWAMDPGDIVIFHGMVIHGGSGNLPDGMQRRTVSAQYLGADVRLTQRPGGCNPDFLPEFAEHGRALGDHPACGLCPTIGADGRLFAA
ncbi:MAG: phytanoyl-CoA dioxygenase family protein [Rhodospirillales bacterium]|nr:phytanoyl-CoA dioxygenase family protein [Rhodospirillales bacterium]